MDSCSQSPSIESFSYSWLVNLKPSFEFFESPNGSFRAYLDSSSDEASSFIEMDPKLSPSKRFFVVHQDFNFDFPTLQPPLSNLVHADELISNGFLIPLFAKPLDVDNDIDIDRYESSSDSVSVPSTPLSSPAEENISLFRKSRSESLPGRYKRFPKRIFLKYFGFVRPLWLIIRGRRSNARVHVMKSWENENSPSASPRSSLASCPGDIWRRSYDSESSIHEAVLHCKRTIGSK